MGALDDNLTGGEVVLYRTRCQWFGGGIWLTAVFAVAFAAVMPHRVSLAAMRSDPGAGGQVLIGLVMLFAMLVCLGMHLVAWRGTETAITNMRVLRVTGGLIYDNTAPDGATTVPLKDIEAVHVEQNDLFGGLFGYGTIVIKAPAKYGSYEVPTTSTQKIFGKTIVIKTPGKYGPQPTTVYSMKILGKRFVNRGQAQYSPQPTGDSVEIALGQIPHPDQFCALLQARIGSTASGTAAGVDI